MKLIVLHVTGLGTAPREELDGRTLLDASVTENLDDLARRGSCGTVRLLPEGLIAGPGTELLGFLGYVAEAVEAPSLGALEALGVDAPLYPRDVAFRVNLCSLDDSGILADTTGAGIAEEDALALMAEIDSRLSSRWLRFYPGRHFAHVMVSTDGPAEVRCFPAPAARGEPIEEVMPAGEGDGPLRQLIWDSVDILEGHRINHQRREEGLPPANVLWPWAPGRPPEFRHFGLKTGLKALALANRLQVIGAAKACGVPVRSRPRTLVQMNGAVASAAQEHGIAYLHLDVRDLFEYPTEPETHVEAVAQLDTELVGQTLNQVRTAAEVTRLLVLGTWAEMGWEPRPDALWAAFPPLRGREGGAELFTEASVGEEGIRIHEHGQLLREALTGLG